MTSTVLPTSSSTPFAWTMPAAPRHGSQSGSRGGSIQASAAGSLLPSAEDSGPDDSFREYRARQQTINDDLGEEVDFVVAFVRHFGPKVSDWATTLNYGLRIVTGLTCYHSGRWHAGNHPPVPPTDDERKALSDKFTSAARKPWDLRRKVKSGTLDDNLRTRLERHHFLHKGGRTGRWMCDGLATQMETIGYRLKHSLPTEGSTWK